MAVNILLKRSATASKRPLGASMAFGELNLNYDAATGGIFYKDSNGGVVKVGPCQVSDTAPNSTPGAGGSTGNSAGEFWFDTATDTLKVYDGTDWVETGGAVQSVTGTAPISVDDTDPLNPVISVDAATTTAPGVVQLNNTTSSTSTSEALTAAQGKSLQDQIDALAVSSNLTLAGTLDASTGDLVTVTTEGAAQGFVVGDPLPAAATENSEFFVIATVGAASYTPPGGSPTEVHVGDWFLSNGTVWNFLDVGFQAPYASTTTAGVVQLATDAEVQAGTNVDHAVTPSGLQSKVSDSVNTTSSTTIASSTAVKTAFDAAATAQSDADAAQATANQAVLDAAAAQSTADGALQRSGGSMTGNLYISNSELQIEANGTFFSAGTASFSGTTELNGSTSFFFTPTWLENIGPASQVTYDNTASGLAAIEVQAAIDELDGLVADAQATADDALPLAGGSMTGNIVLTNNAQITTDASTGLELIADLGTNFLLQSTSAGGQIDAQTLSLYANSSDEDALYLYTPGTGTIELGTANLVTTNGLQVNGDAGTAGYILQSNGAGAAPTWVPQSEGDVTGVSGTAPITVDNTDPQNPVVGINAASTTAAGAVQLNDTVTSTSTSLAATANSVKVAYDAAIAAQGAAPLASATVLFVNGTTGNNSTAARGTARPYLTITAALAAASEGDTIFVAPGNYAESVTLSKGVNLVGTFTDQAISSGPKITGTFTVSISGAGTRNWAVTNFQFVAASAGNNTAVVSNNSFGSGGIGTFTNCFFQQFSSGSLTEQCFATSGTWTRSLYMRNCTFDGNFTHNAGTTTGASGYLVLDNLLGIAGDDKYYKVMTGTVEFRNPSNALAPVLHTGGVAVFSNVLGWISNVAATTTIFGGTGFAYKGTSAGLGQAVAYFTGQGCNVVSGTTWGKLSIGTNVIYAFGNVNYDTSLATLSGIPLSTISPNPNGVLATMARPQWNYLTTASSVAAANQLGVVLDSTNGNVYTVTAYDAGTY